MQLKEFQDFYITNFESKFWGPGSPLVPDTRLTLDHFSGLHEIIKDSEVLDFFEVYWFEDGITGEVKLPGEWNYCYHRGKYFHLEKTKSDGFFHNGDDLEEWFFYTLIYDDWSNEFLTNSVHVRGTISRTGDWKLVSRYIPLVTPLISEGNQIIRLKSELQEVENDVDVDAMKDDIKLLQGAIITSRNSYAFLNLPREETTLNPLGFQKVKSLSDDEHYRVRFYPLTVHKSFEDTLIIELIRFININREKLRVYDIDRSKLNTERFNNVFGHSGQFYAISDDQDRSFYLCTKVNKEKSIRFNRLTPAPNMNRPDVNKPREGGLSYGDFRFLNPSTFNIEPIDETDGRIISKLGPRNSSGSPVWHSNVVYDVHDIIRRRLIDMGLLYTFNDRDELPRGPRSYLQNGGVLENSDKFTLDLYNRDPIAWKVRNRLYMHEDLKSRHWWQIAKPYQRKSTYLVNDDLRGRLSNNSIYLIGLDPDIIDGKITDLWPYLRKKGADSTDEKPGYPDFGIAKSQPLDFFTYLRGLFNDSRCDGTSSTKWSEFGSCHGSDWFLYDWDRKRRLAPKVNRHIYKPVYYPLIDLVNPVYWGHWDVDSTDERQLWEWTDKKLKEGRVPSLSNVSDTGGRWDDVIWFPYDTENRKKHFHGVIVGNFSSGEKYFRFKTLTRTWIADADGVHYPFMALKSQLKSDLDQRTFIRNSLGYEYLKLWNIGNTPFDLFPVDPSNRNNWSDYDKQAIQQKFDTIGRPHEVSFESNLFEPIYDLDGVFTTKPWLLSSFYLRVWESWSQSYNTTSKKHEVTHPKPKLKKVTDDLLTLEFSRARFPIVNQKFHKSFGLTDEIEEEYPVDETTFKYYKNKLASKTEIELVINREEYERLLKVISPGYLNDVLLDWSLSGGDEEETYISKQLAEEGINTHHDIFRSNITYFSPILDMIDVPIFNVPSLLNRFNWNKDVFKCRTAKIPNAEYRAAEDICNELINQINEVPILIDLHYFVAYCTIRSNKWHFELLVKNNDLILKDSKCKRHIFKGREEDKRTEISEEDVIQAINSTTAISVYGQEIPIRDRLILDGTDLDWRLHISFLKDKYQADSNFVVVEANTPEAVIQTTIETPKEGVFATTAVSVHDRHDMLQSYINNQQNRAYERANLDLEQRKFHTDFERETRYALKQEEIDISNAKWGYVSSIGSAISQGAGAMFMGGGVFGGASVITGLISGFAQQANRNREMYNRHAEAREERASRLKFTTEGFQNRFGQMQVNHQEARRAEAANLRNAANANVYGNTTSAVNYQGFNEHFEVGDIHLVLRRPRGPLLEKLKYFYQEHGYELTLPDQICQGIATIKRHIQFATIIENTHSNNTIRTMIDSRLLMGVRVVDIYGHGPEGGQYPDYALWTTCVTKKEELELAYKTVKTDRDNLERLYEQTKHERDDMNERYSKAMRDLELAKSQWGEEGSGWSEQLTKLKDQLKTKEDENQLQATTIRNLQRQKSSFQTQASTLLEWEKLVKRTLGLDPNSKVTSASKAIEVIKKNLSDLESLKTQNINWETAIKGALQISDTLTRDQLTSKIKEVKDALDLCTTDKGGLSSRITELNNQHNLKIQQLNTDHIKEREQWRETETNLNNSIRRVEDQKTQVEGRLHQAQGQIATLESNIKTKDGEITSLKGTITSKDSEIATLQGSINTKESELSTLKGNIQSKDSEISTLKTTINSKDEEIERLKSEGRLTCEQFRALAGHHFYDLTDPTLIANVEKLCVSLAVLVKYMLIFNVDQRFGSDHAFQSVFRDLYEIGENDLVGGFMEIYGAEDWRRSTIESWMGEWRGAVPQINNRERAEAQREEMLFQYVDKTNDGRLYRGTDKDLIIASSIVRDDFDYSGVSNIDPVTKKPIIYVDIRERAMRNLTVANLNQLKELLDDLSVGLEDATMSHLIDVNTFDTGGRSERCIGVLPSTHCDEVNFVRLCYCWLRFYRRIWPTIGETDVPYGVIMQGLTREAKKCDTPISFDVVNHVTNSTIYPAIGLYAYNPKWATWSIKGKTIRHGTLNHWLQIFEGRDSSKSYDDITPVIDNTAGIRIYKKGYNVTVKDTQYTDLDWCYLKTKETGQSRAQIKDLYLSVEKVLLSDYYSAREKFFSRAVQHISEIFNSYRPQALTILTTRLRVVQDRRSKEWDVIVDSPSLVEKVNIDEVFGYETYKYALLHLLTMHLFRVRFKDYGKSYNGNYTVSKIEGIGFVTSRAQPFESWDSKKFIKYVIDNLNKMSTIYVSPDFAEAWDLFRWINRNLKVWKDPSRGGPMENLIDGLMALSR